MSPPTEQLIRDYLNRLSVAARDRLGPDDRRALLERTRKLIERKSDFAGRPTTLEVGKVLARLGDPVALVEQEWRRLTAVRGEMPAGSPPLTGIPHPVEPEDSWDLGEPAEPGRRGLLARVLRRERGRAWRSDAGWPTAAAIEDDTAGDTTTAPATTRLRPRWPFGAARDGGTAPYPHSDLPGRNGTTVGTAPTRADPGAPRASAGAAATANGTNGTHFANGTAAFETDTDDEAEAPARVATASRAVGVLTTLVSRAWQQPLEATAIILLGLGGVLFPPVFALGALVALGSKLWHYRDKWVGLVLPPVLTIIGLAAGIAFGGRSHGFHDGWVSLNIVSRLAAVLGAGYLAWRMGSGRRPPSAPPWNKPHRVA